MGDHCGAMMMSAEVAGLAPDPGQRRSEVLLDGPQVPAVAQARQAPDDSAGHALQRRHFRRARIQPATISTPHE